MMILSYIHRHPISNSSTDNIDLPKRRFIAFGYFLPGFLHLVVADDTVLFYFGKNSLRQTVLDFSFKQLLFLLPSCSVINHSERQKSQGNSEIIDTIDNLHTLITKCFFNHYVTGLFVMCACKIYRMRTRRNRSRRQHGNLRKKIKPSAHHPYNDAVLTLLERLPHPVVWTAFVFKPSVNRQDHFTGLQLIVEHIVLIAEPEQLVIAAALADVHAEFDEHLINDIFERIRLRGIERALDSGCSLVVGV